MGAWGLNPFDSDGALDFTSDLADGCATLDDNYEPVAGSVDFDEVEARLRRTLQAAITPSTSYWDHAEAYAALGLVAARLAGASPKNHGTTLFAAITDSDPDSELDLGLANHGGALGLTTPTMALRLASLAAEAARSLAADRAWLEDWSDPEMLHTKLTLLAGLLCAPAASK